MVRISIQLAVLASVTSLASAGPVSQLGSFITIPIIKKAGCRITKGLVHQERARIQSLSSATTGNAPIVNEDVSYLALVTVGTQSFHLIVDTGSSNTWVGAETQYNPGSTSASTGSSVSVSYGSGSFSGKEYTDKVTLGGLTVTKQSIGAATTSSGFNGVDGILGVGPVDLTEGTVSNARTVPTFLDNLHSQGTIASEVLGVYFAPERGSDTSDANGELTLGGVDTSKFSGTLTYTSTLKSGSFSPYWGIAVSSVTYGSTTLVSSNGAIVDTGTTLIYIPTAAYNKFLSAAGGKTDDNSGLAVFTTKPTGTVTLTIGGRGFALTPAQYLVPTAQYSNYGLASGKYYAWINDGGNSGVDFIIGQKFLENYYSVFDTTNSRVGFATRT